MKRLLAFLVAALLLPASSFAQTSGLSVRAIKQFDAAMTSAGYFGVPRYATASLPSCTTQNRGAIAFDTSTLSLKACDGSTWTAVAGTTSVAANTSFCFNGAATYPCIIFSTPQTPDAFMFLAPAGTSRAFIFTSDANPTFDRAHANPTTPTIYYDDGSASTTKWGSFTHDGTDARFLTGAGSIRLLPFSNATIFGADLAVFSSNTKSFIIANDHSYQWSSTGVYSGSVDLTLGRDAAATLQLGTDVNGTGVAQTIKGPDGITGSNVKGGNLSFTSGKGTGNAAGAQTCGLRDLMTGTGTSAQTQVEGFCVCESKTLSNTTAITTALVNIAAASNSGGGAEWTTTIVATDGTNFDVEQQTCNVGWVNKAGTFTISGTGTPVCTASVAASNSGSTTVGSTVTGAASVIAINATPAFTTIAPTTVTAYTTIRNNSPGAVTCQ